MDPFRVSILYFCTYKAVHSTLGILVEVSSLKSSTETTTETDGFPSRLLHWVQMGFKW